jgi:hypothetical protein
MLINDTQKGKEAFLNFYANIISSHFYLCLSIGGKRKMSHRKRRNNQHLKVEPGVVAHTYNPSHLGDRGQEDCRSRPAWAKFMRPHVNKARCGGSYLLLSCTKV